MKRNKHTLVAALLLAAIATAGSLYGQNSRHLSLNEAIDMSLQNSGKLKIANAKVAEAIAMTQEAKNNHLPDVKASGSYLRLSAPDVNLKIKSGSSTSGSSSSPKVDQLAYGMVNVSMPLFSGFRVKYGIESAKYLEQAARLDAEIDKEEVIQNTVGAYSNLYKAQKSVELVKENLQHEEKRVKDFSNLEKNGLLARNDLLKAQLQQSNIELSLLEAENNLKITNINMSLLLGLPENTVLLPDSIGFTTIADEGSIATWEQTALDNRKDRAALSARVKAADIGVRATKSEYYPGLAFTGGLIAADIPNVVTVNSALNAGIGLQYNLGSLWKTGAKVNAAKARLHQVQAAEGILSDRVRLEINHDYQLYVLSLKKIAVYKKSVEQAGENYRITKNKYDNNLVTTTELLDADVAQLQAQLNYTFSKADALVAYKKLQQTAGILK